MEGLFTKPFIHTRIQQLKIEDKAKGEIEKYPNNNENENFTFYSENGKNIPGTNVEIFPRTPVQTFYPKK